MATQNTSLAVKYRPQTFDDVCGQATVKQILQHQIDTKTFKQGYLMAGHFGCGKTTIARIFAKAINGCNNDIIEIDAATYNSVDQIRVIAEEARKKPLVGNYKIFVIDECFSGDSLVRTPNGDTPIKNIKAGDSVYNLLGETVVKDVHNTSVPTSRLCCVNTSNGPIITTRDHLFFTSYGWVPASKLAEGDELIDYASLQNLWKAIPSEVSKRLQADLLRFLQNTVTKAEYTPECDFDNEELSRMWKDIPDAAKCECYNLLRSLWLCLSKASESGDATLRDLSDGLSMSYEEWEANMQSSLCECSSSEEQSSSNSCSYLGKAMCNLRKKFLGEFQQSSTADLLKWLQEYVDIAIRKGTASAGIAAGVYAKSQSSKSPRGDSEDACYEGSKRYLAYMDRESWWQWSVYQSAVNAILCAWEYSRAGVCDTNENGSTERLSYVLQGRPRLSKLSVSDRGGWQFPLIEIPTIIGSEEDRAVNTVRVDSVTFYESGDRNQPEFSCFDNSELDSGSVTMYDLTVEGSPSYIVNGVFVHNCHMLSAAAANAFLKVLEEPPATAIFILCTTDPQKLLSTILSRVQRYDFTSIPIKEIISRLRYIADNEHIVIDDPSIEYIAKLSGGGMRDAISMLDKVSSLNSNITIEVVASSLSVVSYSRHLALLQALINKDIQTAVKTVYEVADSGTDMRKFMNQFMWTVCDVCNYFIFNSFQYINIPEMDEYKQIISKLDMNKCLGVLSWVKQLCSDLRNEANPKDQILVSIMLLSNKE